MDAYHNILVDRYCALLRATLIAGFFKDALFTRIGSINHVFTVRKGTTEEGRIAESQRVQYQGQIKVYPLLSLFYE